MFLLVQPSNHRQNENLVWWTREATPPQVCSKYRNQAIFILTHFACRLHICDFFVTGQYEVNDQNVKPESVYYESSFKSKGDRNFFPKNLVSIDLFVCHFFSKLKTCPSVCPSVYLSVCLRVLKVSESLVNNSLGELEFPLFISFSSSSHQIYCNCLA